MGAEDHCRSVRHRVELVDEYRAETAQPLDDKPVVHDLVAHVDRRAEKLDGPLDDVDRAIHACAEAARIGEQHFHADDSLARFECINASMMSIIAPVVIAMSATLKAGKYARFQWK